MAKISLREYNREIEKFIASGRIDEAIDHCRYILESYPKHISTYRLLGKAYLEIKKYSDAADILQRVLSSVPDDFVSHVGMSIIREDEGNIDSAIWHMERAYEVQPANAAIQDELRRLYGHRDGLEPYRIQLTRGALARMYAKGHLYQQAISELRAALSEDHQRPDLLVLLARMYAQAGQRIEAAETCTTLLNKLPYCLEANLILADILAGTERVNEIKAYRQRVEELDPYAAHLSPNVQSPEQVPDSAVTIERHEWVPGKTQQDSPAQPDWASSLGIDIEELEPEGDKLPEWLSTPSQADHPVEESQEAESMITEEPPEPSEPEEQEIPDWMRSAGWEPADTEVEPTPAFSDLSSDEATDIAENLEQGEIPDWMRELEPKRPFTHEVAPQQEGIEGMAEGEFGEEEISGWSSSLPEDDAQDTTLPPEIPAWLAAIRSKQDSTTASGEESEIPDWLRQEEEEEIAEVAEGETRNAWFADETTPIEGDTKPIRVKPMEPLPDEEEAEAEARDTEGTTETSETLVAEWEAEGEPLREGVSEEWESGEEPAETDTVAVEGEAEEWEAEGYTTEAIVESESWETSAAVGELEGTEPASAEAPLPDIDFSDEDAAMAWLESLAAKQGALEEELLTSPDERKETPPPWIQELSSEADEAGLVEMTGPEVVHSEEGEREFDLESAEVEVPEAEVPEIEVAEVETLAEAGEEEGIAPAEVQPEIGAWLGPEEELAEPAEPSGEELLEKEKSTEAEIPEWLVGLEEDIAITEEGEPESEVEIPEWLRATTLTEEEISETAEELPEWIYGSVETAPSQEVEEALKDLPDITEPEELTEAEIYQEDTRPVKVIPKDGEAVEEELMGVEGETPEQISEPVATMAEVEIPEERIEEPISESEEAESAAPAEGRVTDEETELPEWLSEFTRPDRGEEEEFTWTPPVAPTVIDINTASLAQLERLPGIGFILAQNITAFREAYGPFTNLDDLQNVSGMSSEIIQEIEQYVTVTIAQESRGEAATIRPAVVEQAWEALTAGNVSAAVDRYIELIKKEEHLDEVIADLEIAVARFPQELPVYQALGDAYVRNDQIQEALDTYTKAEELLL